MYANLFIENISSEDVLGLFNNELLHRVDSIYILYNMYIVYNIGIGRY